MHPISHSFISWCQGPEVRLETQTTGSYKQDLNVFYQSVHEKHIDDWTQSAGVFSHLKGAA